MAPRKTYTDTTFINKLKKVLADEDNPTYQRCIQHGEDIVELKTQMPQIKEVLEDGFNQVLSHQRKFEERQEQLEAKVASVEQEITKIITEKRVYTGVAGFVGAIIGAVSAYFSK